MRKVFENRSEGSRTERVVRLYTGGIREVTKWYGDGESWARHIIIPRRLVLNEIRKLRSKGCVGYWDFWELLPRGASALIRYERHGGPGQSFVHEPYRQKSSRKFIVIYQSGGLDI